ncbi:MAG: hypothetical protein H6532_06140 [Thermoleophilales bacterium]|nr:hypothetical protein [Thermoleophilales bacterium]
MNALLKLGATAMVFFAIGAAGASAADLPAPAVKWTGPTFERNRPGGQSKSGGEVSVRFWNARFNDELKLGRLTATIPYECTGKVRKKATFVYDEREDKGPDDAKVWVDNDFGVKMIHFKLVVDRTDAGGKFVWVAGSVKYPAWASNDMEPDASGRIASYMEDCRSVGGVGFPLGWRGDRTPLAVND